MPCLFGRIQFLSLFMYSKQLKGFLTKPCKALKLLTVEVHMLMSNKKSRQRRYPFIAMLRVFCYGLQKITL
jgi:hypothetical protein